MRYRCASCKRDFTIKTGTLFGESKIPLKKWFIAIFLLTQSKKGISSVSLAKFVGVSQKTAWFMDHRIREALKQNDGQLFGDAGIVEADETYVGGKHRRKHGFQKKAVIFGMIERGGLVKAFHVPHRGTEMLLPKIKEHISPKARIMTDEAKVYQKLPRFGYTHGSVKHGKRRWVYKDINTNSIESFWALFKRGYHGTHHWMSKKHLQRYIDECVFRFNMRTNTPDVVFLEIAKRIANSGKLSYKALTYEKGNKEKGSAWAQIKTA